MGSKDKIVKVPVPDFIPDTPLEFFKIGKEDAKAFFDTMKKFTLPDDKENVLKMLEPLYNAAGDEGTEVGVEWVWLYETVDNHWYDLPPSVKIGLILMMYHHLPYFYQEWVEAEFEQTYTRKEKGWFRKEDLPKNAKLL